MNLRKITPSNTEFVLISFEGPDAYANAGGLGSRMKYLSRALTDEGFDTRLFFIGDPDKPGEEVDGKLMLHRWCQWISRFHPLGVYDGEEGKLCDFNRSLPGFLVDNVIDPNARRGRHTIVMAEEWHTAEVSCIVSDLLRQRGRRDAATIFWNANNTYSFGRIDWPRLQSHATITTVSRYMRQIMEGMGLNPLVVGNGIPVGLLGKADEKAAREFKSIIDRSKDLTLFKMARYDPTKGWVEAVQAASLLKQFGNKVLLLARGGIELYGQKVLKLAMNSGLRIAEIHRSATMKEFLDSLERVVDKADMINIRSFLPHEVSRTIFSESDAVLANSRHEPFGLVGLESMASGGLSVVGGTGEDYARHLENAIVLDKASPHELIANILHVNRNKRLIRAMRKQARRTAEKYSWPSIIRNQLLPKLEFSSWEEKILRAA